MQKEVPSKETLNAVHLKKFFAKISSKFLRISFLMLVKRR
jgi:hypothetical protein